MNTGQIVLYVAPQKEEEVIELPQIHRYTGEIHVIDISGDTFASNDEDAQLYFAKMIRKDIMKMSDSELVDFLDIRVNREEPPRESHSDRRTTVREDGSIFSSFAKMDDILRDMGINRRHR